MHQKTCKQVTGARNFFDSVQTIRSCFASVMNRAQGLCFASSWSFPERWSKISNNQRPANCIGQTIKKRNCFPANKRFRQHDTRTRAKHITRSVRGARPVCLSRHWDNGGFCFGTKEWMILLDKYPGISRVVWSSQMWQ